MILTVTSGGKVITNASEQINRVLPWQYTNVTMRTSRGDDIVFTPTSFEALFPNAWRSWDMPDGTLFDPGQWVQVRLTNNAITTSPISGAGVVNYAVSLVGYREVSATDFNSELGS